MERQNNTSQLEKVKIQIDSCMYVYLYTVHITDCFMAVSILGEVERQLVKTPMAAAISPYLISTTHPTPCMKCYMKPEIETS